jgi:L-alanine-DL-glutamate epimerase-like enolase superfamily enzyme
MPSSNEPAITSVSSRSYTVPTDQPEADGTLAWDSTTVVVAEVVAGGVSGLGWTYSSDAAGIIIEGELRGAVCGGSALAVPAAHEAMVRACRNLGRPGVVGSAISAVDIALWDCKAKILDLSLADLFGRVSEGVALYGSGGFTTYDEATARRQLERWTHEWAIPRVKMKIGESWGRCAQRDLDRVVFARGVVGDRVELFVDANGAYSRKQAVRVGQRLVDGAGVTWFEEPVSSDDLAGLKEVKERLTLDVAAGEYGYDEVYFARLLEAGAVDCLQIDVTRCGGFTSWLRGAALAAARGIEVSAHCAPNLHAHVGPAVPHLRHVEYFHDHQRLDDLLFDGLLDPTGGWLTPRHGDPGHGMTLKEADAERFRAH